MDHVTLGKNRATSRDTRGAFCLGHDLADLFDAVFQARGLLVEERAGSRRAFSAGGVIGDPGSEGGSIGASEFIVLACSAKRKYLELSPPISKMVRTSGCSCAHSASDGFELIFCGCLEGSCQQTAP